MLGDILGIGTLLQTLLNDFVCYVETGIVLFTNYVLDAVAAVIKALLAILPSMPGISSMPTWAITGYNYVSYFFPVDYGFTLCATLLTLWISWVGVAVVFRWGRLIGGRS